MNIIVEINGKFVHSKVKEWTIEAVLANESLMLYVAWGLKNKSIKSLSFSELK